MAARSGLAYSTCRRLETDRGWAGLRLDSLLKLAGALDVPAVDIVPALLGKKPRRRSEGSGSSEG